LEIDTETETFLAPQLAFKQEYCVLQLQDGTYFAILNRMTFRSLTSLSCFGQLNYTALVSRSDWEKEESAASKGSIIRCVSLDINISGPECVQTAIASELSQAGLFLQPPPRGTTTLPYENPQFLHLPGVVEVQEPNVVLNPKISIVRSRLIIQAFDNFE
jgi:hypothetical protein